MREVWVGELAEVGCSGDRGKGGEPIHLSTLEADEGGSACPVVDRQFWAEREVTELMKNKKRICDRMTGTGGGCILVPGISKTVSWPGHIK